MIPENKLKIAMSYSPQVGGLSSESVRTVLTDLGTEVVNADYRQLVTTTNENIDEILSSSDQIQLMISNIEQGAESINTPDVKDLQLLDTAVQQKLVGIFEVAVNASALYLRDKSGLVIPGNNAMVDPRLYGKEKTDETIDMGRAIAEMALIHVATQRGLPILAICGGHQILNTYHGGTLKPMSSENIKAQGFLDYDKLDLPLDSDLRQFLPTKTMKNTSETVKVFGMHRETIEKVGGYGTIEGALQGKRDLLSVAAISSDKEIEAITENYGSPIWGLQFHPEVAIKGLDKKSYGLDAKTLLAASDTQDVDFAKNIFVSFVSSAQAYKSKHTLHEELLTKIARKPGIDGEQENAETIISTRKIHISENTKLKQFNKSQIKEAREKKTLLLMTKNFLRGAVSHFVTKSTIKSIKAKEKDNKLLRKDRKGGTISLNKQTVSPPLEKQKTVIEHQALAYESMAHSNEATLTLQGINESKKRILGWVRKTKLSLAHHPIQNQKITQKELQMTVPLAEMVKFLQKSLIFHLFCL